MRFAPVEPVGASLVILAWIAASLAATPALSQEAIPTASRAADGGAPATAQTDTLRLGEHLDDGQDFLRPTGPCGGPLKTADGKTDKAPHGQVWAGVGTHGYREIGGVTCLPLGDHSAVTIAVDAGHIDGWGRRRW